MFWSSRCFGMVDVLEWSIFWSDQCFGAVNVLEWSMFWSDRCFGAVDVLACSMFRHDHWFGRVDGLVWSMFRHSKCLRLLRECHSLARLRGPYPLRGEIFYYGVQKYIYFLFCVNW